ncbi:hypothetical protein M9Y10_033208 [Tritrichomonas musculus]|uniref:Uncharacterized protein n=1 Tax=Tritrichomonas musculus TaxID=1915356 RepID=A0ABR2GY40_9EUKA
MQTPFISIDDEEVAQPTPPKVKALQDIQVQPAPPRIPTPTQQKKRVYSFLQYNKLLLQSLLANKTNTIIFVPKV